MKFGPAILKLPLIGRLAVAYERRGEAISFMGFTSELHATIIRCRCGDPSLHEGLACPLGERDGPIFLGSGLVTDVGADDIAQAFAAVAGKEPENFNFQDSGTGTVAAAVTDTDLGTPAGPTTRATGTQSNPATKQYRSAGTISYAATLAITEWGLFNQAARGAGSRLFDRRVFSVLNVVSGDSVQFQYTLTVNSGG